MRYFILSCFDADISYPDSSAVRDTWLTLEGSLVTSRYEAEFDHGEFCVDTDQDERVVAVMCDACKQGVISYTVYILILTMLC